MNLYTLTKKQWTMVGIGAAVLAALLMGYGIWRMVIKSSRLIDVDATSIPVAQNAENPVQEVTPTVPGTYASTREGWQVYANSRYRFSISFPGTLQPREYQEDAGAMSFTAQDDTGNAFQVYVTPYREDQVTKQRFLMDETSGVMSDPMDVVIDGVRATMFFGKNNSMGDTREVWFIRKGYLYEVVTYKKLDEWLSQIMSTWKFLD